MKSVLLFVRSFPSVPIMASTRVPNVVDLLTESVSRDDGHCALFLVRAGASTPPVGVKKIRLAPPKKQNRPICCACAKSTPYRSVQSLQLETYQLLHTHRQAVYLP